MSAELLNVSVSVGPDGQQQHLCLNNIYQKIYHHGEKAAGRLRPGMVAAFRPLITVPILFVVCHAWAHERSLSAIEFDKIPPRDTAHAVQLGLAESCSN